MDIRRGSVYWWSCPEHNRQHIQEGVRPVVVVSNDNCNQFSGVVTVVPFTTRVKRPFPQQVAVVLPDGVSIALCDQVTCVPVEELQRHICDLHSYQMDQVDVALAIQLGFVSVEARPYSMTHGTR
jgi:mRNA interferase MazF